MTMTGDNVESRGGSSEPDASGAVEELVDAGLLDELIPLTLPITGRGRGGPTFPWTPQTGVNGSRGSPFEGMRRLDLSQRRRGRAGVPR